MFLLSLHALVYCSESNENNLTPSKCPNASKEVLQKPAGKLNFPTLHNPTLGLGMAEREREYFPAPTNNPHHTPHLMSASQMIFIQPRVLTLTKTSCKVQVKPSQPPCDGLYLNFWTTEAPFRPVLFIFWVA